MRKILVSLGTALVLAFGMVQPAEAAQPRNTLIWAQVQSGPYDHCTFSTTGPKRGGVLDCYSGTKRVRAAKTEDSRGYWLADFRGNGQGDSFVRVGGRTLLVECWISHPFRKTPEQGACPA